MESKNKELRDKIVLGVKLAVRKLIERKRESDGELVYSKHGKVVRIRASGIQE